MLLMSDQLLDVSKSKSKTKTFVRALCTLKVLKRFNELECKEAASQTLIFLQRHLESLTDDINFRLCFDFKILATGMSLYSHESPQDSLIKKLSDYTKQITEDNEE